MTSFKRPTDGKKKKKSKRQLDPRWWNQSAMLIDLIISAEAPPLLL
jgi:hypothetical protein